MHRPWHLWAAGILSLLCRAGGAFDYLMVQAKVSSFLANFTPRTTGVFRELPHLGRCHMGHGRVAFFVLGSLFLLMRSRFASAAFFVALIGILATSVFSFGLSEVSMIDLAGPTVVIFSAAVFVLIGVLWLYSRAMTRRGYLR